MRSLSLALVATLAAGYVMPIRSSQWPQPKSGYLTPSETEFLCVTGAGEFSIDAASKQGCQATPAVIQRALTTLNTRYVPDTSDSTCSGGKTMESMIKITYTTCLNSIGPATDESYTLNVSTDGVVTITADNQYGVRHALNRLGNMFEARMIGFDDTRMNAGNKWLADVTDPSAQYWVFPYTSNVQIEDAPRLEHRGVMIDTARVFVPVESILNTIEGMGAVHLNVFHWHVTDDQSFPALMDSNPTLMKALHGEYCAKEPSYSNGVYTGPAACRGLFSPDAFYTDDDFKKVVSFADEHGVRVVFEIDQPAHATSWVFANMQWLHYGATGIVMNIKDYGDEIWNTLGKPIMEHFKTIAVPGEHIHFGADEFPVGVFDGVDETVYVDAWLNRVIDNIESSGRLSVAWQDGLKTEALKAKPSVIAHIWDDEARAVEIANRGNDLIWSPNKSMYLDCGRGHPSVPDEESHCGSYHTWYTIYLETPDVLIYSDADYDKTKGGRVLGGEVPLWNDNRGRDEIEVGMWPRAAAWAGAAWEQRDTVPKSGLYATTEGELQTGIVHAVDAQTRLSYIMRKISVFTPLQTSGFISEFCMYKGMSLCDGGIAGHYTDKFNLRQSSATPIFAAASAAVLLTSLVL